MNKLLTILLSSLLLLLAACSKDDTSSRRSSGDDDIATGITLDATTIDLGYKIGASATVAFTSSDDWTITNNDSEDISVSSQSGTSGSQSIIVKALTTNTTNLDRSLSFTIKSKSDSKTVTVNQPPVFVIEELSYKMNPKGDTLTINFSTEEDMSIYGYYRYDEGFLAMCKELSEDETETRTASPMKFKATRAATSSNKWKVELTILPNETGMVRSGRLILGSSITKDYEYESEIITVTQNPTGVLTSTDYSKDGVVTTLQKHSKGSGVPIVIMGDAFVDTQHEDGTYDKVMQETYKDLFTLEPMTSLKDYFDVYSVAAVSENNVLGSDFNTVFSSQISEVNSTLITGDDDKCLEYAEKVKDLTSEQLKDLLIVIVLNDKRYGGTCSMEIGTSKNQCARGLSIAYIPLVDEATYGVTFEDVLHHEAIGHGLGKLDDEYGADEAYEENGSILDDEDALTDLKNCQKQYAMLNVTLESDVLSSPWKDFYNDALYASEKLGCYAGACGYPKGVYRATDNSLMRSGSDEYTSLNVVGRSLLYKRIMNIANGFDWTYDYDTFVSFDNPAGLATTRMATSTVRKTSAFRLKPLPRPRIIEKARF